MASADGVRTRALSGRLVLWQGAAIVGVLVVLAALVDGVVERHLVDQLADSLVSQGRSVQVTLPPGGPVQEDIVRLGRTIDTRVTVIRADGVVVADSERDPRTMENERDTPEVRRALAGEVGVAARRSATTGISYLYAALPAREGLVVRTALPLSDVRSSLLTIRMLLVAGFGLAALVGLVVLAAMARGLVRPLRSVTAAVERFGRGDLSAAAPEAGTDELVLLARSVNRMRDDVAARLGAIERDRLARDAILSALEEGVVLFDPDGSVIYANERALRMVGGALEHARHLAPPTLRQVVEAAAAGSKAQVEEITSGLMPRILVATAVPVPGDGNVLLVLRDVTEARTVDAVRRDFVANASHELKTPLASIQALAETIESAAADDPSSIPRFAEQLEREAIRLSRVVSDLLDLSRLEGEPGEWTTVRFDRLVREETASYRERAGRAGLALAVTADGPAMVNGSPRDLGLLVRNLVENAVQYTRPGGSVAVSVATEDGQAVLQVRDTGLGIPLREQGRVFERFYRVDRARSRETGGTGLGLSIVKHVAENHGGRVSLRSELGRGSTFTVRLPLAG